MVVKIMRWRPWPPIVTEKFSVKLTVKRLEGLDWVCDGVEKENEVVAAEIRWKGPKVSFRRTVKRNCTREEVLKKVDGQKGAVLVEWDEEFCSVCTFSGYKVNVFHPWDVNFTVYHDSNQGIKKKIPVIGSGTLNLTEYISKGLEQETEVQIPLSAANAISSHNLLYISLRFVELKATPESIEIPQSPPAPLPLSSASGEACFVEKDEVSALKASLRRVKIFTEYVSARRAKKAFNEDDSEGRGSKSEEGEYLYDPESDEEFDEGEIDGKNVSAVRKSFSYGSLAFANYAGASFYLNARMNTDDEDWVYYSNRRRSDADCSHFEDLASALPEQPIVHTSKRSILPWRKRKMSFRSPKAKGEPLLKKAYGEEGGDDIDFDRRQLSSDESISFARQKTDEELNSHCTSASDFGDDNFTVGAWESKVITSRDGQMKIQTEAFFASIDQRSERAAGESACTALVAVIADWLHKNHSLMPIKSQFDSLIRDGSLEWRNLCGNQMYMERFPDKHFDLETVLHAKIRDLCVVPEKSFIGFFHPEGMEEGNFDFLHGAMSFDNIWDEITLPEYINNGEAPVYIVSWNDHFFILKVEAHAYYIIDTLGERLHEGCSEAYILKFDSKTTISKVPNASQTSEEKSVPDQVIEPASSSKEAAACASKKSDESTEQTEKKSNEEDVVCHGKEACKEYIKSFLASIPIRELQADIKKGLAMSTPIHHRLQIEFHFTKLQQHPAAVPMIEDVVSLRAS